MTISEKVAYLKGLADGLDLDKEPSKEGKIIAKIIDVLEDVGFAVEDLEVEVEALTDGMESMAEDLSDVETALFDEDDEDEDDTLDEHDVVRGDARKDSHAHAGKREDDLQDDSAADHVAELQAEHGDRRDERVAKHVARDDGAVGDAEASGGAHVVLVELLDHGRADDARHLACQRHGKRDAGHCHACKPSAGILRERRQGAGGRQQVQRGGEQQDEQHRQPERRCGDAGDGEDADDLVGPTVAIQGGNDAEDGAGDDGDDEAEEAELQRDGQRGGDASGHGLVRGTERAQIAMEEADHVVAVANDQRIVEAVLDAVGLQLVG